MGTYRLAVMDGDGIGPEVVASVRQVLEVIPQVVSGLDLIPVDLPVGLSALESHGTTLPACTLAELPRCDGWILGPVTTHAYQGSVMPNPSAVLRKRFELYANIRPARSFPGVSSLRSDVDVVVVRENTEGFYADRNMLEGSGEFKPAPGRVRTGIPSSPALDAGSQSQRIEARLRPLSGSLPVGGERIPRSPGG